MWVDAPSVPREGHAAVLAGDYRATLGRLQAGDRDIEEVSEQVHERLSAITAPARERQAAALADLAGFEAGLDALAGDVGVEPALLRAALGQPEPGEERPAPDSEDLATMLEHFRSLLSP